MSVRNTGKEKQEEVLNSLKDNFIPLYRGNKISIKGRVVLAKSHMALGLLGGLGISYLIHDQLHNNILLPLVILGSVLPDIDEPRSFIGKKLPIISHIISLSFTHRGFTHFFIFPLLVLLFGCVLYSYHELFAMCCFALSFGIFIHQLGDMLTISGIPYYFFPLSNLRAVLLPKVFRFKTGGIREKVIFNVILLPLVLLLGAKYLHILNNFDVYGAINIIGGLL